MTAVPLQTAMASATLHVPETKAPLPEVSQRRGSTIGKVNYVKKPVGEDKLYLNVYTQEEHPTNLDLQETEVTVHDVHTAQQEFSLEKNGFILQKMKVPDIDWENKEEIEKVYYPVVERMLLEVTGASRVHIFDHTLRLGRLKADTKWRPEAAAQGQPVGMAHVDYTHNSGIDRLDALLPEEADQLRKTPFAVIQVWRPLKGPVRSSPLAMIDANTLESSDLSPYAINFPERTGWNFAVHHNPNHRWYFADQMQTDEAYVFVCFDSRLDRARFTPHTGFRDESVEEGAPPRSSVELRSYVFWENEAPQEVQRVW